MNSTLGFSAASATGATATTTTRARTQRMLISGVKHSAVVRYNAAVPAIVRVRTRRDNELPMLRFAIPSTVALFAVVVAVPAPRAGAADAKDHWAFKAPTRPGKLAGGSWVRNDIDSFTFWRMRKEKLSPSPEADKVT